MRVAALTLVLSLCACTDPYEEATRAKLAQLTACDVPLGSPAMAHVVPSATLSDLTVCPVAPGTAAGFVILQGPGRISAYGDTDDPNMANAVAEPGTNCSGSLAGPWASRAFWAQVQHELRARVIVQNGSGMLQGCELQTRRPELLSIQLFDWADLDATIAIVQAAQKQHDICSPVGIEVAGPHCAVFLSAPATAFDGG